MMPPPPDTSVYSLPSGLNCLTSGPVPEGEVTNQYTSCFLKCSSGAERTYVQQSEFGWDAESLQAKYCQAEAVTPTATNTPASSVETSEPVKQADPMLTEEVTMCDPENQLISLRIAEGVHVTQFHSLETTIGSQAVTCGVNPSNASLYTCDLPTPLLFPAQITVIGDGSTLNDFLFDGSSCISDTNNPPNNASSEDTPVSLDCIAHPSDPGC